MNNKRKKRIIISLVFLVLIISSISFVYTYSSVSTPIIKENDENSNRIIGNTVYINELDADYYYYMGLNYTYHVNNGHLSDNNMPSLNNQNKYTTGNLAQVKITYKGTDLNGNTGYVSLDELQDTFVYNKIVEVTDNYVQIQLIDNPFTNRPNNMGFNGWVTTNNDVEYVKDNNFGVTYARIPVTFTNGTANMVDVTFNASWVRANIGYVGGSKSWDSAFNSLKDAGMQKLDTVNNGSYINGFNNQSVMAGFFKRVNKNHGDSINGLYNSIGNKLGNSNCDDTNGCILYEYINYSTNNNVNYINMNDNYYYLNTKDTNIIVMNENTSGDWTGTKPFTLTSILNGVDYRSLATWNVSNSSVICKADTTIENIKIDSGKVNSTDLPSSNNSSVSTFSARWYNVRLGRGIIKSGNNVNFTNVLGGYNESIGLNHNTKKYRFVVESGFYNNVSLTSGTGNYTNYVNLYAVFGSDYDKAIVDNNSLEVYYTTSGSYGAAVESPDYLNSDIIFSTVKSGSFGISKVDDKAGFIAGSIFGGSHNSPKNVKVEGGWIYNLIGDGAITESRSTFIDVRMFITGGRIEMVIGGSSDNSTHGHRFIQMTGGIVGYSVIGGNNAYNGESASLNGNTLIYIGGNALVGDEDYISNNSTLYGIEAGSVFGSGNGNISSLSSNKVNSSNVIINDEAIINNNIYLGGNYASVGTNKIHTSKLKVLNGTVNNSIYGGSKYNGMGSSDYSSNIDILISGGDVLGSIYGGSDINGVVYGNVNINLNGGKVASVFGGGNKGAHDTYAGTFVSGNIIVNAGQNNTNPIVGNIYGASNEGVVNGIIVSDSVSSNNVTVNIYGGTISNVFGGAKGSEGVIPYVLGKTTVNVYGGRVTALYGANDVCGTPNGGSYVYLKGGTIDNAYGGGNSADINTTNIELDGATVGSVFGGSNIGGTASNTNVRVTSGNVTSIHGGNDYGGFTEVSNINIDGGTITNVYGGGRFAATGITNVSLNKTKIINAFGGGENADVTVKANVVLNGADVDNLFGGSDSSGEVTEASITLVAGEVDNIFGGNNLGGITYKTTVDVNGSTMETIYGGGNEAYTQDSTVIVRGSNNKMKNVYGGSKMANVDNSTVQILGGMLENVYGGSHLGGTVQNSSVYVNSTEFVQEDVYLDIDLNVQNVTWQSDKYKYIVEVKINFVNNTDYPITEYTGTLVSPGSTLFANYTSTELTEDNGVYTFTEINRYYGTNPIPAHSSISIEFSMLTNDGPDSFVMDNMFGAADVNGTKYNSSSLSIPKIDNIYGGNNQGGETTNSVVVVDDGLINYIYGGGNNATSGSTKVLVNGGEVYQDIYGGGNNAITLNDTDVKIVDISLGGSIYGGGNYGTVGNNTFVYIHNASVGRSVYAGGNGESAIVYGNTKLNIDGVSKVNGSLFGGGNAAATGSLETNNSSSVVNIAGATILGNVYGGANTSVLYGTTNLNVGAATVDDELDAGDIYIGGTLFGGGEANAEGSEEYDYSFISVTEGIVINIDAAANNNLDIIGSIFGSGNASSTSGYSHINISNYGNTSNLKRNISIQRTGVLNISNSYIELLGATDRTNEYSSTLYSLSRIDELNIKNNSTLYLKNGANLLKKLSSLKDNEKASVIINDDKIESNVDNRIYLYEKIALNVALNEQVTSYGEVFGMTFLGMYKYDEDDNLRMYLYDPKYDNGADVPASDLYAFNDGSYVLGKHLFNHDNTVDGFYTNKLDLDTLTSINYEYVNVTPKDANYYMWVVGELVMEYEFDLTASKYSTLGTYELPLINSSAANTTFKILGLDYSELSSSVNLVDPKSIPRISSDGQAEKTLGLSLKSSNTGWITVGETDFFTNDEIPFSGTSEYLSENSNVVPSLLFSLYHSKNISKDSDLGSVKIAIMTLTPINETDNQVERINITINLKTALYSTNNYEGAMTQGEEFDVFTPTAVDITSNSKFSAYYSLFLESSQNIYKTGYHRVLLSSFVLPENTKITMVDLNSNKKEYYYYVVTSEDVVAATNEFNMYGEATYEFSNFVRMGSSSLDNKYSDEAGNNAYYNNGYAHEEFIFIVDFSEADINGDKLQNTLFIELRDSNNRTLYSVLGVQHSFLTYDLYSDKEAVIELDAYLDTDKLYLGGDVLLTVNTDFVQQDYNDDLIYDTNFFDQKLGIKITFTDANGNTLNGTDLLGLYYEYNGDKYYPRVDGSVRINIAERVANVSSKLIINTDNSNIASGLYNIKIESFGSADGIYYGLESSDTQLIPINIIDTLFGLKVTLPDRSVIIDKNTGFGTNDNNALVFEASYSSGLSNPNLTISLYRRDYSYLNSNEYEKVDLLNYVSNTLTAKYDKELEYVISNDPSERQVLFIYMKENLMTGTYKFVFTLYDGSTYIGDVYQYVIIK